MKLTPLHSAVIFALLAMSAMFFSVSNYRKAQYAIIKDMNQALAQTLRERQDQWITPDTIQSYRSHLSIGLLKQNSILCYTETDKRKEALSSRSMLLDKNHILGYANCSMLDILGMSNQRTSLSLFLMAMLWAIWSAYYLRRKKEEDGGLGSLSYSPSTDTFYNKKSAEAIRFTPMQHQLMQLFLQNDRHQLSKQEICDALWPKKPDASETLYTLIRRIKPVIEDNSNLSIESERGKSYRLVVK